MTNNRGLATPPLVENRGLTRGGLLQGTQVIESREENLSQVSEANSRIGVQQAAIDKARSLLLFWDRHSHGWIRCRMGNQFKQ